MTEMIFFEKKLEYFLKLKRTKIINAIISISIISSQRKPTLLATSVIESSVLFQMQGSWAICPKNARDARDAWKAPM